MEIKNIKFEFKPAENKNPKNTYIVKVRCDANDGDYVKEQYKTMENDMTELDILMIAYLNLSSRHSIPNNWKNANIPAYVFGGGYVGENMRFGTVNSYYDYGWLYTYATSRELLLFCGAIDAHCHSICSIDVTYYDKNGIAYNCIYPDLGELFNSEVEFIDYIKSLPEYNNVRSLDPIGIVLP